MGDLYTSCGTLKEPQDVLDIPGPRVQHPRLSFLSNSAGLIDSIGVQTLFFSGFRHAATSLLSVMGLVTSLEKIRLLEKGALLEENLTFDGRAPARGRMVAPYIGLILAISTLVFSILGIAIALGFSVSGATMLGVGVVSTVSCAVEYSLKKLPLSKESFGSQLLLVCR